MMGTSEPTSGAATTPSAAVVEAVAEAEGWDPAGLPEPLYDAIDPDALDALLASAEAGQVTFAYLGYEVTVSADGSVTLSG